MLLGPLVLNTLEHHLNQMGLVCARVDRKCLYIDACIELRIHEHIYDTLLHTFVKLLKSKMRVGVSAFTLIPEMRGHFRTK